MICVKVPGGAEKVPPVAGIQEQALNVKIMAGNQAIEGTKPCSSD